MLKTYVAQLPCGRLTTRASNRAITHALVARLSYDAAKAEVESPDLEAKSRATHARYLREVEAEETWTEQKAYLASVLSAHPDADSFVAAELKRERELLAYRLSMGGFDEWVLITWTGSEKLAHRYRKQASIRPSFCDYRVLPAVVVATSSVVDGL